jgi:hypothetical protein
MDRNAYVDDRITSHKRVRDCSSGETGLFSDPNTCITNLLLELLPLDSEPAAQPVIVSTSSFQRNKAHLRLSYLLDECSPLKRIEVRPRRSSPIVALELPRRFSIHGENTLPLDISYSSTLDPENSGTSPERSRLNSLLHPLPYTVARSLLLGGYLDPHPATTPTLFPKHGGQVLRSKWGTETYIPRYSATDRQPSKIEFHGTHARLHIILCKSCLSASIRPVWNGDQDQDQDHGKSTT